LPIYDEEASLIERLMKNVTQLDYPKEKLQIQILDDSENDDILENVKKLVKEYRKNGYDIELIHRNNRKGYKAGALNYGLKKAKGRFIAIFDVDTIIPKDFLKKVIPYFYQEEKLAFVQTRCIYENRWHNLVTRASAIERDVHFLIEQPAKSACGLLINHCGTAGVWRKSVLKEYRWDENVLTEDIELSYRVQADGWKGLYLSDIACIMQLPPSLTALKVQQARWTAGFVQSFKKLWGILINSKISINQKLESVLHLSSPIACILLLADIFLWPLAIILETNVVLRLQPEMIFFTLFTMMALMGPFFSPIVGLYRSDVNKKWTEILLAIPAYDYTGAS
jgi:cellulose synthase/poly-beta-1,6-N-acetylglucosamine synthase-like glycosyltransferase